MEILPLINPVETNTYWMLLKIELDKAGVRYEVELIGDDLQLIVEYEDSSMFEELAIKVHNEIHGSRLQ